LFEADVFGVFVNTIFDPVLDVFRVIGVSRVVRHDWHDPCGQQVVVPVERVVGAVTKLELVGEIATNGVGVR